MFFSDTYFYNFRNLRQGKASWSRGFNLLMGPNGAGKTNFIEGLNLVSGWGPLESGAKISQLSSWKPSIASDGKASLWARACGEEDVDLFASISARCSLKCGERAISASAMRSKIPVLTFLSDGMSLVRGGASSRRALLDRVGAVISPSYASRLNDFRKALRQKAALLRRGRDASVADRVVIPLGAWLWTAREEILKLIRDALSEFDDLLSSPIELVFSRGGGIGLPSQCDDFKASLVRMRERERASGTPLVGPQRDDVKLVCGGMNAALFLSRGQSRRAAAALILASALVVERRVGRKPILIFDEITSELDESGRHALIEALLGTGCQVFAATADRLEYAGVEVHRLKDGFILSDRS
jgi:DNA replication and repair protein RecF